MTNLVQDKNRLALKRSLTSSQTDQLVALFQTEWWTKGRTRADTERALQLGGPMFAFVDPEGDDLVAFARTITDGVYKAMIFDIIVKTTWRGTGLGALLMETVLNDPALANVKHRELYCLQDMVPFYEKWGFTDKLPGLYFMRQST
ncbi:GNAT family N-acetyltransferase [Mesorhizobium sp. AR10]|uniref:GNAT family N-acetyltransferase n=1 Tax=Mesorhizobium sp. AR10 TaxID=2865839 RepID=UPI00215F9ED0|nr:GNAT family N-acetyltransferase [Mesorhizobium sp. AR10]UVK40859.1 GNAT family N-acetyltransferase [Mesorhizobium sp. AR10]